MSISEGFLIFSSHDEGTFICCSACQESEPCNPEQINDGGWRCERILNLKTVFCFFFYFTFEAQKFPSCFLEISEV